MIYNAYLADPNNTPYDIFLRQLCCHPMLSEKIRENISNKLESLSDMKDHIKKMYFKDFEKANEIYNECENRINRIENDIKEMEKEGKTNLIGYNNLKEDLEKAKEKIPELQKIKEGKEKTLLYYKTFLDLISDINNIKQQDCSICIDPINENDLGITGHAFHYTRLIDEEKVGEYKLYKKDSSDGTYAAFKNDNVFGTYLHTMLRNNFNKIKKYLL